MDLGHPKLDTSPERSTYSWREGTPGQVFPAPLQNLVPLWLNSMMDYSIGQNNVPVSVYSAKIVQQCLNEDSLLFLRNLTEKVFAKNICPNGKLFACYEQTFSKSSLIRPEDFSSVDKIVKGYFYFRSTQAKFFNKRSPNLQFLSFIW